MKNLLTTNLILTFVIITIFYSFANAQAVELDRIRDTNWGFVIPSGFEKGKNWYESNKYDATLFVTVENRQDSQEIVTKNLDPTDKKMMEESKVVYPVSCDRKGIECEDLIYYQAVLMPMDPPTNMLNCTVKTKDYKIFLSCIFKSKEMREELVRVLSQSCASIQRL